MTEKLSEGVYPSLTIEDYHRDDLAVSKTRLTLMDKAPALFLHARTSEDPKSESKSLKIGRAFHAMLDKSFDDSFLIGPDVATRADKTWKAFEAQNPDKTILKPSEYAEAAAMAGMILSKPEFGEVLGGEGRFEQTYVWRDSETNLLCKCRPDFITADNLTVVDFKSAVDASHYAFQYAAWKFHYYVSAAFTFEGVHASTGVMPTRYLFFVVQSSAPYLVAGYEVTAEELSEGREFLRRNLGRLKECYETGDWPGLPPEIRPLGLPSFRVKKDTSAADEAMEKALSWVD